jgi:rhamnose transport system ATP-binding protein
MAPGGGGGSRFAAGGVNIVSPKAAAGREDNRAAASAGPVVRLERVSKSFGATRAVDRVDLDLAAGEVHGLIGENGAGKSTLMRVLAGFHPDYGGSIALGGRPVRITHPRQARSLGIALVHQELSLLPELTVAENIFLGREPYGRLPGFISRRAAERPAAALLAGLGIGLGPAVTVERLSIAERQLVEIAKGVSLDPRVLILDEPTSSLTYQETSELFRVIAGLKQKGTAIVYISHKLDEIFATSDRVTVLRDGARVATAPTADWTEARLVNAMVGRDLSALFPHHPTPPGAARLEVRGLERRGAFRAVSLTVRSGEIVGLYGLIGSGRTSLAEALFGLAPADAGEIRVDGRPVAVRSPGRALGHGIAMAPEDRRARGLVPMLSVRTNLSLSALKALCRFGFVDRERERGRVARLIDGLMIRAASPAQEVANLSGGNQQKVVLGRSLMVGPKILVLDEPTRGIDVVAKAEVHGTIDRLAREGLAVLLISSELPEILGMSDRVLVMRDGGLAGEVERAAATEEILVGLAAGVGSTAKASA